MNKGLSFNDICLVPADFSMVITRKEVEPFNTVIPTLAPKLPIISSNMDAVYSQKLVKEVQKHNALASLHRFMPIDQNVEEFKSIGNSELIVSVGVGKKELVRAEALRDAGANIFLLDVANAAGIHVVEQFQELKKIAPNAVWIVGNFGTAAQINTFNHYAGVKADLYKISIGSGSACITSTMTGVGTPSVTCLQDCLKTGLPLVFDGGIRTPGDFCKAIALGATAVMMGRNFAACEESGAKTSTKVSGMIEVKPDFPRVPVHNQYKLYRGSAAKSSYETQGKTEYHRTPEGEEYWIPVTGTVEQLLKDYEGGLRSSMSYLNAFDLTQYVKNAKYMEITSASYIERQAHGKGSTNG